MDLFGNKTSKLLTELQASNEALTDSVDNLRKQNKGLAHDFSNLSYELSRGGSSAFPSTLASKIGHTTNNDITTYDYYFKCGGLGRKACSFDTEYALNGGDPMVKEGVGDQVIDNQTEFTKAINFMLSGSQGKVSIPGTTKPINIMSTIMEANTLAGVGAYGVIFLVIDGDDHSEPVDMNKKNVLTDMLPLSQLEAIESFGSDGSVDNYHVTVGNFSYGYVHKSRIIRIVDDGKQYHEPRLKKVIHYLTDNLDLSILSNLDTRLGQPKILASMKDGAIAIDKDVREIQETTMRAQLNSLTNGVNNHVFGNVDMQFVHTSLTDPNPKNNYLQSAVATALNIPIKIFIGNEQGKQATTQDYASYDLRMRTFRDKHIIPRILQPIINALVSYGIVPKPKSDKLSYTVVWNEIKDITGIKDLYIAVSGSVNPTHSSELSAKVEETMSKLLDEMLKQL